MTDIFVNLKRFDVPTSMGGICPGKSPTEWAAWVIEESVRLGLGRLDDVRIGYFFPEAILPAALTKAADYSPGELGRIIIGAQSVFREDVKAGGNFGAFTSNLPAAAAANLGCTWSMIGHSEERKDKFEIMAAYDSAVGEDAAAMQQANRALHELLNREARQAFERGLSVLFCVGETAEERGEGSFEEQRLRIKEVLSQQLIIGLAGLKEYLDSNRELIIAYEPRWAIGPGKTPPGPEYIGFVSALIKETVAASFGFTPAVLYGGGLKRENAAGIGGVETIDGGLVALTKFTQPVAFDPEEFKAIIETYQSGNA